MEDPECLDDEVIAALAEGDTSARDALVHLETCATCRELVSLARVHRSGGTPAPARLAGGVLVGRHRIIRPLGAGGMGVVYLARDTDLDRDVAVKLLRGPRDTDALTRESRALAKLDHPNVVTAYEVGRHGDETYLVMEYVESGTVRDWLAAAPRTPEQIVAVYADAACGLAAAHAAGLVHRDVKPDNILVGSDGRARVSDFGLADVEGGGTERYLAPEVRRGAPADAKSDQWSLCASLDECLPDKPPHVWRAVARGLSDDRFASLDELADALAPPRRKRWIAIAAVNLAVLATTVGLVAASRDTAPVCSGALPAIWDTARRAEVAARVAPAVVTALDAYATQWGRQQVDVCHAPRAPLTELRAACLASRRRSLAVVVDALAAIDPATAPRAARAVAMLPELAECDAAEHLAARQPRPRDAASVERLAQLELRIDSARTNASLGGSRAAIPALLAAAADAEPLGYHPLLAEALRTAGREQLALRDAASVGTLRRALNAAQAGGDESAVAELAVDLYVAATLSSRPEAERDDLAASARAAVARMRWREDATLHGVESYLAWAAGQDALARDALDLAEREMRTAVALGVATFGPDDRRVPILRNGLAAVLKRGGKPDEAAVNWALSLQVTALASIPNSVIADLGGVPVSLVDAAWELHDVGRDVEALAFVHRARRETASAPPSIFRDTTLDDLEATIALARGDLAAARELNARAVARLGPTPVLAHVIDFYTMRGDILAAEGDCAGAGKWYRYVIEQSPHRTLLQGAKLGLARCHAALSELDDAAKLFDAELAAGIEIARERPRTMRLAADVHWRLGHHDRARALAAEALRELGLLPALVDEHVALVRWLIARSA